MGRSVQKKAGAKSISKSVVEWAKSYNRARGCETCNSGAEFVEAIEDFMALYNAGKTRASINDLHRTLKGHGFKIGETGLRRHIRNCLGDIDKKRGSES